MIATQQNRLDPSLIPDENLRSLLTLFAKPGHVTLVDDKGNRTELPEVMFHHLARIVQLMSERKAIVMLPEEEAFTTQAAANYLGMSRQFFVNLLEDGALPFHKVGSHRRVLFKDLLDYERKRDADRKAAMSNLTDTVMDAGLYFPKTEASDPE
jgi:excisionase family DNA binding protein